MLALGSMGIQEWIAGLLKFRAKDMAKTIRSMLQEPDSEQMVDPTANLWTRIGQAIWRVWLRPFGESIRRFFAGTPVTPSLVTEFYNHPFIRAMAKPGKRPSYIPSNTFALTLFDLAMNAGTEASPIRSALEKMREQTADLQKLVGGASNLPTDLKRLFQLAEAAENAEVAARDATPANQAAAMRARDLGLTRVKAELAKFESTYTQLKPILEELLKTDKAKEGLAALDAKYQSTVKRTLGGFLDAAQEATKKAEDVIATARTNVEQWFDDTMARLSGRYKRRAQVINIVLGIGLAVLLNVDAVVVAQTLWREPTLRQAVVAQAEKFQLPADEGAADEVAEGEPAEGAATEGETSKEDATPSKILEKTRKELEELKLPIGWIPADLEAVQPPKECRLFKPKTPNEQADTSKQQPETSGEQQEKPDEQHVRGIGKACWVPIDQPKGMPYAGHYVWLKVVGWLLSGFASAQGAPFWFDVLKKLTNVRLAGANPAEQKPAKSKSTS